MSRAVFLVVAVLLLGCPAPPNTSQSLRPYLVMLRTHEQQYDRLMTDVMVACPDEGEKLIEEVLCEQLDSAGVAADQAWMRAADALFTGSDLDALFTDLALKIGILRATWEVSKP